jgi:serine phosphatase RsbU (regulator of sigma subunit)
LLADVSGHGTSVAATAADLRTLMRRFVNRLDQAEFVRLLNQQFIALSQSATFATAVVTTFFAPSRRLTVCNAGHPRPFLYRAAERQWGFLGHDDEGPSKKAKPQNIPLGLLALAEYQQIDIELEPGDCLLSYTDALVESSDADGEMLGEDGLLRIMRLLGDVEPQKLIETLLTEIEQRYPENLAKDDVTLMLVRASGQQPRHPFVEKVKARLRFAGSVIRGLSPWGARAPLPDLNLANIGGAIVPSLARRWRARGTGRRPPTA